MEDNNLLLNIISEPIPTRPKKSVVCFEDLGFLEKRKICLL
jgi:hypothetical protein